MAAADFNSPVTEGAEQTINGVVWRYTSNKWSADMPLREQVYPAAGLAVSTGTAWGTPKTAPSGVIVGTTDTQTLTNKSLTATEALSFTQLDKGTVGSGTVTFFITSGPKQKLTVGGALTIAIGSKPSEYWELEVMLVNGGMVALTMPTVSWLLGDGTTSASFADMDVTLAASGVNTLLFWGVGSGTVYGRAG